MSDEKNHYGSGIAIAAGALLAIYLFLPVVFLMPIFAADKHHWISRSLENQLIDVVIAPATFIADRVPVYERMLEAEGRFCERHGVFH
jgi:hypothetical protein